MKGDLFLSYIGDFIFFISPVSISAFFILENKYGLFWGTLKYVGDILFLLKLVTLINSHRF